MTDSAATTHGLLVYIALALGTVLLNIAALMSSTFGSIRASLDLHHPLVSALMSAPLLFFEETPLGRILSRIAGDIDIIDIPLPINIRLVVDSLIHISTVLVVISITMPVYIVFVIPFTIGYLMILNYFLPTNRQLKRIESAQRSCLLSVLSQNIEGAESIRAYRRVKSTILSFYEDVDSFLRCRYLSPATARWLSLRLELIGNVMIFVCSVLVSLFSEMDLITAGEVGLCVSYALSLTDLMNFSVRMMALSEANIVAVERIKVPRHRERRAVPIRLPVDRCLAAQWRYRIPQLQYSLRQQRKIRCQECDALDKGRREGGDSGPYGIWKDLHCEGTASAGGQVRRRYSD